jgi:DNA-directed RNA polymerase subunit RPC12/RpoP
MSSELLIQLDEAREENAYLRRALFYAANCPSPLLTTRFFTEVLVGRGEGWMNEPDDAHVWTKCLRCGTDMGADYRETGKAHCDPCLKAIDSTNPNPDFQCNQCGAAFSQAEFDEMDWLGNDLLDPEDATKVGWEKEVRCPLCRLGNLYRP